MFYRDLRSLAILIAKGNLSRRSLPYIWVDLLGRNSDNSSVGTEAHIDATIRWICTAQDRGRGGGISARYHLTSGWASSYPETTGYTVPTFIECAHVLGRRDCLKRAKEMAEWLVTLQLSSGAFPGGTVDIEPSPSVFNTGQILQGLVAAYQEFGHRSHLLSALRAADWLLQMQDEDGAWRRELSPITNTPVQTFNVRTAWVLLQLWQCTDQPSYRDAALANIRWTLQQQLPNGWFENNFFYTGERASSLHTIAYVFEGLINCGVLLNDGRTIDAAVKLGEVLHSLQKPDGALLAAYNHQWRAQYSFVCLTGLAQVAKAWLQIYMVQPDHAFLRSASQALNFLKRIQYLDCEDEGILGGIKGSLPVYGLYEPLAFPNWAAKFFLDALLLEIALDQIDAEKK